MRANRTAQIPGRGWGINCGHKILFDIPELFSSCDSRIEKPVSGVAGRIPKVPV